MESIVKIISSLVLAVIVAACDTTKVVAAQSDSASVENFEFSLHADNDACVLHYKTNDDITKVSLTLKPPCFFSRHKDGSLKTYSYPDANVTATMIVIGTPADAEKRSKWNLTADVQCGEQNQGVLIKDGAVQVSSRVGGELFCRDRGVDEKNFWRFAHE